MGIRLYGMTCGWLTGELGHLMEGGEGRIRLPIPGLSRAVPMVRRLSAGGSRIRTLGPALHTHRFGPPSCRPRDGPGRQTEITRWRPGTKRSTPASAAEYTGPPPGGSPLARYRGC